MIFTNKYKYFMNSNFDPSEEIELSEDEFIHYVNRFPNLLKREYGSTYVKFWILENGEKTDFYFVKRVVGVAVYE